MAEPKKTLILAGGTGGHIFPGLALAEALKARGEGVYWLGSQASMEAERVPQAGIAFYGLPVKGLRGKGRLSLLLAPWRLLTCLFLALAYLRRIRPDQVVGFGGFASGPGGLAAWLLRIPLSIHEQNALPGFTNRCLAPFSRHVFTAFPQVLQKHRPIWVGNPVRHTLLQLPPPEQRYAEREGPLRLLVVGGSLGAQVLNEQLPAALALLAPEARPVVRHQTGRGKLASTQAAYQQLDGATQVEVTEFIEDMGAALAWADLVICRAGALTLAEMMAVGVASILVPYPFAVDDHQTHNARYLADQQAALLVPQNQLKASQLAQWLGQDAASWRLELQAQAQCARALAKTQATEDMILELERH